MSLKLFFFAAMAVTSTASHASTTSLASSSNPAFVGQAVTLQATVSGSNPTGPVQFVDDGGAIAGCASVALSGTGDTKVATCTTSWVAPGSHQITASYILDPYNGGSTSTITQVVAASTLGTATIVSNPYGLSLIHI